MEEENLAEESATPEPDHRGAAAELIRSMREEAGEAETKAPDPAPKADPEPTKEPTWQDTERELQAKIEARKAQEAEARQAQQASEAESRAAQRERELQERIAAFERDPVAYYEKHGVDPRPAFKRFTEIAAKGPAAKVETTVEALQAKIADLEQRLAAPRNEGDDIREYIQAQERQRAEQAFVEHASAAETYPLLSRLPPESRVQLAHEHASRFREAGVDFDLAMLARHAEGKLRHQFELLGGTLSTGQPAQRESSAGAVRATGPTAITNAAAAETSGALRDLSVEERRELAAEQLRRLTMAQQQ